MRKECSIPGIKHCCIFMSIGYFLRNVSESRRSFVLMKKVTFLISITIVVILAESFAAIIPSENYLSTSYFTCFVLSQKKYHSGHMVVSYV